MPSGQGRQARLPFLAQRAVVKISQAPAQTKKSFCLHRKISGFRQAR
jgi:hypothetical protein